MAHVYHAHQDNGKVHEVTTNQHHDDHTDASFKAHLGRIIDGAAGSALGAVIIRFVYKGKK